ncbi:hypothetical protein [Bacillus mycoides]|uniref:Group-specific protein n=1 Tax=Bacillus mycoides TaxID=1405 RepID=A0ABX6ZA80_BACMY|nr:hypothetical protein [Bacillus mycoides]AJH18842.1 hypothetical protein BG05_5410 [Bacillus mycoides]MDR4240299.1 hypothetical protein [Bacillus mycoides]MED1426488.1 hypothetical protein [Bacillus mycoides]MED1487543.1 hypothetical protein [Bacillus mycoides]QQA16508.1 hypothetical protein I6G81_03140 [Bacillus mycoides]
MSLYAVCLAESVEDDKLISVVKANSSEEAIEYHFRKFVCASETMKAFITDFSSEGFFYKYFGEFEWDTFREEFAFIPNFIDLMEKTHKEWEKASEEYGYVPSNIVKQAVPLLSDEMCLAIADFLVKTDLETWAGDAIVTEVEIEVV